LHPNKDECTDKIVKAHAIQNNRILTKIAENGWVETLNGGKPPALDMPFNNCYI